MEQAKIGKFISECRKKQKLTQEQLAEKLGVTNKSISRWENGKTMPDVSLFEPLCNELNISVSELLKGERINDFENQPDQLSQPLIESKLLVEYSEYIKRKTRNATNVKTLLKVSICLVLVLAVVIPSIVLFTNETFLKETYVGTQNQEIFIPRYSYFHKEAGFTVAIFYSFRPEKQLEKEIDQYMDGFEYYSDESWSGYKKGDLYVQKYEVVDHGLYRVISITYESKN